MRDLNLSLLIIKTLKEAGYGGKVAVSCHCEGEYEDLQRYGADEILIPYRDAANEAVDKLTQG